MNCPTCNRPMVALLLTVVCDHCERPTADLDSEHIAYAVLSPQADGTLYPRTHERLFRLEEHAQYYCQVLNGMKVVKVYMNYPSEWDSSCWMSTHWRGRNLVHTPTLWPVYAQKPEREPDIASWAYVL